VLGSCTPTNPRTASRPPRLWPHPDRPLPRTSPQHIYGATLTHRVFVERGDILIYILLKIDFERMTMGNWKFHTFSILMHSCTFILQWIPKCLIYTEARLLSSSFVFVCYNISKWIFNWYPLLSVRRRFAISSLFILSLNI
jgi:hypothetical protein